jgi:membrane-associated phospholipid phosphatase
VIDGPGLRLSELVGLLYLAYLAALALVVRLPPARRLVVWLSAAAVLILDLAVAWPTSPAIVVALRDWMPGLVILIGYYATGAFFVAPSPRVEAWLKSWDDRLLGRHTFESTPPVLREYLELVYDFCFVLIPAGFAVAWWLGGSADRFWTIVIVAEFIPFGLMPWLQARPPWAIEGRRAADAWAMRQFSLSWVERTTIRANTFPSGHASGSLAVALALMQTAPGAAAVFAVLAVSIAVASVVGRFHYALDAITGLLLALCVWAAAVWLGL